MKKVLFICDGSNFSEGAFRFLAMLNDSEHVSAKGVFFEPVDFMQLIASSYNPSAAPYVKLKEVEKKKVRRSEEIFRERCRSFRIKYSLKEEREEWLADLFAKETRFADLAIISEEMFAADISDVEPNTFMEEALHVAECPVILVPENFQSVDRVLIAYDGANESVFALKNFCAALPQLSDLPTEIVFAREEDDNLIPGIDLLKEYCRTHFDSLGVSKLHFDAKKYFPAWATEKKNSLVVCGSYSRSTVSNTLKASFAKEIIRDHKMPVFIAHNR